MHVCGLLLLLILSVSLFLLGRSFAGFVLLYETSPTFLGIMYYSIFRLMVSSALVLITLKSISYLWQFTLKAALLHSRNFITLSLRDCYFVLTTDFHQLPSSPLSTLSLWNDLLLSCLSIANCSILLHPCGSNNKGMQYFLDFTLLLLFFRN